VGTTVALVECEVEAGCEMENQCEVRMVWGLIVAGRGIRRRRR
jgi:hypothetical protein